MSKKEYVANAILWAAAILAGALMGAPKAYTTILLPILAVSALVFIRPKTGHKP